jgi:hypothetical protein
VATACASPPQGRARWTLKLLAGAMVSLPPAVAALRGLAVDLRIWP